MTEIYFCIAVSQFWFGVGYIPNMSRKDRIDCGIIAVTWMVAAAIWWAFGNKGV